jgi:hypothetical protein
MSKYDEIKKQAQDLNNAFVEAFISYASYDSRRWMVEKDDNKFSNPVLNALQKANTTAEELTTKKAFEMYASIFAKNKFEPVLLNLPTELSYTSEKYGFSTTCHSSVGDYKALDNLARASIVKSKNPDGTYTLHTSFRGTDTEARTFFTFVRKAYLDMSAYYDAFKPLEKAILEYANDPKNKISQINVSGHSLGGAMVPEFLQSEEVKKCSIPFEGITYGAPGNQKKALYGILPAVYHSVIHGKFLELGKAILDVLSMPSAKIEPLDQRITQYSHIGDMIPLAGALAYNKAGKKVTLKDVASENKKESFLLQNQPYNSLLNQKKPSPNALDIVKKELHYVRPKFLENTTVFLHKAITFKFHDMLRYIININHESHKLVKNINSQPDEELKNVLKESMPDIFEFEKYQQRFNRVSSLNTNKMNRVITNQMKNTSKEVGKLIGTLPQGTNIENKMLEIRQKMFAKNVNNDLKNEFTTLKPT